MKWNKSKRQLKFLSGIVYANNNITEMYYLSQSQTIDLSEWCIFALWSLLWIVYLSSQQTAWRVKADGAGNFFYF